MLRRLCNSTRTSNSAEEDAAIERLVKSNRRLIMDVDRPDVKSEAGYSACASLLATIDATACRLHLEPAKRDYRSNFSANYQALFPDSERHYRVDVLEASADQDPAIWVNGDKFEFSAEATSNAQLLQHSWAELGQQLDRWSPEAKGSEAKTFRESLVAALVALDQAWADFEHQYISELIEIEAKARWLIIQAVEQERKLQLLELSLRSGGHPNTAQDLTEYCQEQKRLVACIGRLNSVANINRKGRDDLGVDILEAAHEALRRCDSGELGSRASSSAAARDACNAARVLAQDIVGSFSAMRGYLQKASHCLERVDPHLCNNAGLVSRLVDWEESWEVGARYVTRAAMLDAVCDLVAEVRSAQQLAPMLASMCEDCDVELFLVLPRIIVLCFLADPKAERRELLRSLLPHRFARPEEGSAHGPELSKFVEEFGRAKRTLAQLQQRMPIGTDATWEVLVKRAVAGSSDEQGVYATFMPQSRETARATVENLMRSLESWSVELQRHCPEDWNQFSAVLVECLTGGVQKPQRSSPFQV